MRGEGESVVITGPSDLRPMPFGNTRVDKIRDPLLEPLWAGLRVLAHVSDGRTVVRDSDSEEITVVQGLLDAIAACTHAEEAVLDGHLVAGPLRDTVGIRVATDVDLGSSASHMARHFFLGGMSTKRLDEVERREAAAEAAASLQEASAFIAVDLLWLEGESLLDVPLLERKRLLESVLTDGENVRRTVAVRPPVNRWHAQWTSLGFSEMAVKAANSRYTPGRPNPDWAITQIRRR